MYKVLLAREAEKQLVGIDQRYKKAIIRALQRLSNNPNLGAPLRRELKGLWRMRVGKYRVIYEVKQKSNTVLVWTIEHRRDVYR